MSKRIFDRNSYSKKTLDTFEIIAAYFIDIYYNHLYIEGNTLRISGKVTCTTEGYKHALNAFIQGIDDPKKYKRALIGIQEFFVAHGFKSISFRECIDRITYEFIPKDFCESVTNPHKVSILKMVISQSNKTFLEKLVRQFLPMIIDKHNDEDNLRILQDEFMDILFIERENMYNRFISNKTAKSSTHISISTVETMQKEIKTLLTDKYELRQMINNLKKIIIKKDQEVRDSKKTNEILTNNCAELQYEVNDLKRGLKSMAVGASTLITPAISMPSKSDNIIKNDDDDDLEKLIDSVSNAGSASASASNDFETHQSNYLSNFDDESNH